jgi:hypothetical protein
MKQLMLQHAFRFVNTSSFLLVQNLRSQRALEKIGAVRVGSRLDKDDRLSFVYKLLRQLRWYLPFIDTLRARGVRLNTHRHQHWARRDRTPSSYQRLPRVEDSHLSIRVPGVIYLG